MSNGKGDAPRPIEDKEHFDSEYERIFKPVSEICQKDIMTGEIGTINCDEKCHK